MRYFIEFAYRGTHYHGWQTQPNAISVQETITRAMSMIAHSEIELTGAGRTDAGVHARKMYAHFDFDGIIVNPELFVHKLNSFLPGDISIHRLIPVHNDAHARFDATMRTYEYHIHSVKDPFLSQLSWELRKALDIDKMNQAAAMLFGHTDFECFSKAGSNANTFNCRIFAARWEQSGHRLIFTISADRFLRNMVRAIVGTMADIGSGKTPVAELENILASRDRSRAGSSVPAHGLFLTQVDYDYIK